MCDVIVEGMSKQAKEMQFLRNYKIWNPQFSRDTYQPVAHRICNVISKNK